MHAQRQLAVATVRAEVRRHEVAKQALRRLRKLTERVSDPELRDSIQASLDSVQEAVVNSQEWTLSRSIPELRLGVLGDARSGKSSLIHRFLTGSYQMLEKTESEQHKKEMLVDGQTHLVLIREEAGPPDAKAGQMLSSWSSAWRMRTVSRQ